VGVALAATASLGLVGAGAGTALSAPHATKGFVQTAKLKVVVSKKHFSVSGPTTFTAGSVALKATGEGPKGGAVLVASLHPGYTFKHLRKDLKKFAHSFGRQGPSKSGLRHFDNAVANTTQYGGLSLDKGQTEKGTVNLATAGTYYIWNDSGNVPKDPQTLTVVGAALHQKAATDATVKATGTERWRGDTDLPAKGTITFKNTSKGKMATPHFVVLDQVKQGTTRKDVLDFFQNGHGRPSFALPGEVGTDAISDGGSMTFTYKTPPGDYALMCFFPDLQTGIPHAFMGMVRIVHLS
jgi:hypothetical protein